MTMDNQKNLLLLTYTSSYNEILDRALKFVVLF
jgi:hypothetical protein